MAISGEDIETATGLRDKLGLGFTLLADPERTALRAWGVEDPVNVTAWPATYVVARDGTIAWRSISATYPQRPRPEEILAVLDSLGAAPPP